jgi:hypothetical protein
MDDFEAHSMEDETKNLPGTIAKPTNKDIDYIPPMNWL